MSFQFAHQGPGAPLSLLATQISIDYVQVESWPGFGSGILIDPNFVLTAEHLFEEVNPEPVRERIVRAYGNDAVRNNPAGVELDGVYTPGAQSVAEQADDMGVVALTRPVTNVPATAYIGLGAFADASFLTGMYVQAWGWKEEDYGGDPRRSFVFTDGFIKTAANGLIDPIPGTSDYKGQSGSGLIGEAATGEHFVLGVMQYRFASNLAGGGAYLELADFQAAMQRIEGANPNADPNATPRNFIYGSHVTDVALNGSYRRDVITGGRANETLSGGRADDVLDAGGGNDVLQGGEGNDSLAGGEGADTLSGGDGADTLDGGKGDDTLSGGGGDDDYLIARGDGSDVVTDAAGEGSADRLVLAGVRRDQIEIIRNGADATLRVEESSAGAGDGFSVVLSGSLGAGDAGVDVIVLADATLTRSDLQAPPVNDTIAGSAGADSLAGGAGADVLEGGGGGDTLSGLQGSDTYQFGAGEGADVILEAYSTSSVDRLELGAGLTPSAMTLVRDLSAPADVVLDFGTAGAVRIVGGLADAGSGRGIETIVFGDGVIWSKAELAAASIAGAQTAGADTILGGGGADTIAGLTGDDLLRGLAGADAYVFAAGGGQDVVLDDDASGALDRLELGAGLTPTGLTILRTESAPDDVVLDFGAVGSVTLVGEFGAAGAGVGVEVIAFGDGVEWSRADLLSAWLARAQTSGDDTVLGGAGAQTLAGGAGDDRLRGLAGDDTYRFGAGDGGDVVVEAADVASTDRLELGAGLLAEGVAVARDGSSVVLDFGGSGSVRLEGQLAGGGAGVEEVEFGDGEIWTAADIVAAVLTSSATSGADTIVGSDGEDLLAGLAGDDRLIGGAGADTYRIEAGEGADVVVEDGDGRSDDILKFGPGLDYYSATLVRPTEAPEDLILDFGAAGSVRIEGQFGGFGAGDGIEYFDFDGYVLTRLELQEQYLFSLATAADDLVTGFASADVLSGLGGADTLIGGAAADLLTGGEGGDRLEGGEGDDLYGYARGDGDDVIVEAAGGGYDRLAFDGVGPQDVAVTADAGVVTLRFEESFDGAGDAGAVSFAIDLDDAEGEGVDEIAFGTGEVWTRADLIAAIGLFGAAGDDTLTGNAWRNRMDGLGGNDVLAGLDGDDTLLGGDGVDTLYGGGGNDSLVGGLGDDILHADTDADFRGGSDTLDGGAGNDVLNGDAGDTVYLFNLGDGVDLVRELPTTTGQDTVRFGPGIAPSDILVSRDGDDVWLSHVNGVDRIVLEGFYAAGDVWRTIERVAFDGGIAWTRDDLTFRSSPQGTADADTITGSSAADSISGGDGADSLHGGIGVGNDLLQGDGGADTLEGWSGDDTLQGGAGNDLLRHNAGLDRFEGGDGVDTLDISSFSGATVDLAQGLVFPGANQELIFDVENVLGGSGADSFVGDGAANRLQGGGGADTLLGGAGADSLEGGSGQDSLSGGDGDDALYATAPNTADSSAATLNGGAGNDVLQGGTAADTYLFALGHGEDTISEWSTTSTSVLDVVRYAADVSASDISVSRVGADLWLTHANGVDRIKVAGFFGNADLRWAIERVEFADGVVWTRDQLTFRAEYQGGAGADTLVGTSGPDSVTGADGNDSLSGGEGADALSGGDGGDTLNGGNGDDTLVGGAGDDLLVGGVGLDRFEGGGGVDTLDLTYFSGATVDLAQGLAFPGASQEVVTGVENLTGGSGADLFIGDAEANRLLGGGGADTLVGAGGADTLTGGSAADHFRFDTLGDAPAGGQIDLITDFASGSDKIDLRGIDADVVTAGDQAFTWLGTGAFTGVAGQLRYGATPSGSRTVYGDVDGDGVADLQIQLTGTAALAAGDFLL